MITILMIIVAGVAGLLGWFVFQEIRRRYVFQWLPGYFQSLLSWLQFV